MKVMMEGDMTDELKKTALHQKHVELGARMIEFAGFHMPVWYTGMIEEHMAVRTKVGIFDLAHMGEVYFEGPDAFAYLQSITCNDLSKIKPGKCQYTLLTIPGGGVVDDLIIYQLESQRYLAVINASNIENDIAWFREHLPIGGVSMTNVSDETTLIAIQGPNAPNLLSEFGLPEVAKEKPFRVFEKNVRGNLITVATTGYTGEAGVELIVPNECAEWLWDSLLEIGAKHQISPIGLGARDTLRLEAAYSLYGHELDRTTTPYEAGLDWTVKLDKGDFLGKDKLVEQKEKGITRRIAGLVTERKNGIPRNGMKVYAMDGSEAGVVTSGAFSPILGMNIALAYLPPALGEPGNKVQLEIRKQKVTAETVRLPFYKRADA
ncbi:MAG: glycine cleavage system aminomethyltransferase GcvT [bacterium]|jgi:aminomethyltransferase